MAHQEIQAGDGRPAGALIEGLCTAGVWVGGFLLLAISFAVCGEVLLRKFFDVSLQGIDELAGYGMAISFAWAMPYTIVKRVHIRVDVVYTLLPVSLRRALDLLSSLCFILYLSTLGYFSVVLFLSSYEEMTRSGGILAVPLYGPEALWSAGFLLSVVVLVVGLPASLRSLRLGLKAGAGNDGDVR